MSLKMNFLIITSIVVLTIFVKMVPAPLPDQENSGAIPPPPGDQENSEAIQPPPVEVKPKSDNTILRNNSAEMKLPESNSIIMSLYDNVRKSEYPNKHIVSCEELYRFNEMNKKEIINYSEKTGLSNIHCDEKLKLLDLDDYIKAYCDDVSQCERESRLEHWNNHIAEYREQHKTKQPDIAATILYIKDNLIRYNTYNPDISIGANVFVEYSSIKNDDNDPELVNKMEEFKNLKENDLKGLFQALTSCYLTGNKVYQNNVLQSRTLYYPENAETFMDTFFLNQFRFFYNLSNAEISVIGDKFHVSVEELIQIAKNDETNIKNNVTRVDKYDLENTKSNTYLLFVQAYIKELHSYDPITFPWDTLSLDDIVTIKSEFKNKQYQNTMVFSVRKYLTNEFIRFTSIWQLYKFDINKYLEYKIIDELGSAPFNYDEYTLDGSDGEKLTALEAFKKYFKESLDESYNIVLNMDINVLDESKKNNYYKRTLRTLRNIFQAYFEETETSTNFVQRMVSIAKEILISEKTKQIPDERKKEYLSYKDVCPKPYESDNQSEHKSSEDKEEAYNMMLDSNITSNIKITIKNDYYTCDSTRCALPDTVNCKDVLNYSIFLAIAHYREKEKEKEKEMHDFVTEKIAHD